MDQNPKLLTVTDRAVAALKEALAAEKDTSVGVRAGVQGGGCSGYQYFLGIEDSPRESDFIEETEGVKVFIDPMSAPYIRGTVLDYVSTLQSSGFVFNNPNAVKTCGCGSSFAV